MTGRIKRILGLLKQPGGAKDLALIHIPRYLSKESKKNRSSFVTEELLKVGAVDNIKINLPLSSKEPPEVNPAKFSVDVVICIHNALADVKTCLKSLKSSKEANYKLILVNDGSDLETSDYLKTFAQDNQATLLQSQVAEGYTRAANKGIKASKADIIILLNSDTIVPQIWISKIVRCFKTETTTGIVSPLSNAASAQSIPRARDQSGAWAINALPAGLNIEEVNSCLEAITKPDYPALPLLHGFCLAIRREVIERIGLFDEKTFPKGYGEEDDYCIRAKEAGFDLRVCDDLYVFHAKAKSYTAKRRSEIVAKSSAALKKKHSRLNLNALMQESIENERLCAIRSFFCGNESLRSGLCNPSILFILPVSGGGGGVNSVVQEAKTLRALGVNVAIALKALHRFHYYLFYKQEYLVEGLFEFYESDLQLNELASKYNIVVGTAHSSISLLEKVKSLNPFFMPAYYIQDYEPYFYKEGSANNEDAKRSYTAINDINAFAKTDWICQTVNEKHGLSVKKVLPGFDHRLYYPKVSRRPKKKFLISALVRLESPRRAPEFTLKVLKRIKRHFGRDVEIVTFGSSKAKLRELRELTDFSFTHKGKLNRQEVANLLGRCDIFLDLSVYQGFGRTALEAMASGAVAFVPERGGASEYAKDGVNSFVVDTQNEEAVFQTIRFLLEENPHMRPLIAKQGIVTSFNYSLVGAAWSEYSTLFESWKNFLSRFEVTLEKLKEPSFIHRPLYILDNTRKTEVTLPAGKWGLKPEVVKTLKDISLLQSITWIKSQSKDTLLSGLKELRLKTRVVALTQPKEWQEFSSNEQKEILALCDVFFFKKSPPKASKTLLIPLELDESLICEHLFENYLLKSDSIMAKRAGSVIEDLYLKLLAQMYKARSAFNPSA